MKPLSAVEEGAGDPHLAHRRAVEEETGLYFNGLHEAKAQARPYDPDARRRGKAWS